MLVDGARRRVWAAWTAAIAGSAPLRFRRRRIGSGGDGGEEGDRFRLVTQRSQPGEIVGQVACRHSLEESIDGILQYSMVTVDPAECQGAGAAPRQSGSLLLGSWLDWLDGAMLAGDQFGQLWIGAEAVGADQRSRCDGATQGAMTMSSSRRPSRTASTTPPARSSAVTTGTCSDESPRLVAPDPR